MANISKAVSPSLAEDIEALGPWFHNLHLPDGTQTAPGHFLGDFPTFKWEQIRDYLPADLSGWTALDIGCNAGFYSFELARRGATVTGIDHDPHYLRQARWAAGQYGLETQVRFLEMAVYDLAATPERYDLVLFMGVLYHLRYPLLGLDIVARKVGRRMIFQTLTMPGEEESEPPADVPIDQREVMLDPGWPKMAFIEHRLANDPTNWWAPTHACVEAMLRSAGLRVLERPGHEIYVCEPGEPREELAWIEDELRAATGLSRARSSGY
ncbi:MAG: TIGR04290 family methyltransferase [Thermoanaerobaculia bacterium]